MKKKLLSNYLEFANLFFVSVYLLLIGCTILNPAFTTGSPSTEGGSGSGILLVTDTVTTARTNGEDFSSSSASDDSSVSTSGTITTSTSDAIDGSSGSSSSGTDNITCGNCEIEYMEDCDICISNFRIGTCTEECNIYYPTNISENNLALYCGDFNYCDEPDCGQCEADIVCYVLHYKKIIKSGKEPGTFKLIASSWITEPIDPNIMVTLTYESIQNSYLIPNNGATLAGLYNGDIWITETPYYKQGMSVSNITCSLTFF